MKDIKNITNGQENGMQEDKTQGKDKKKKALILFLHCFL